MKNGKYSHKARKSNAKLMAVLVSVVLVTVLVVSATVAYLMDKTDDVTNTFTLAQVTSKVNEPSFDGKSKNSVPITNTSDVDAYIRAEIIATWMDEEGNVLHKKPVLGQDYSMTIGSDWVLEVDDGFYYHKTSVAAGEDTGTLIASAAPSDGKNPQTVGGVDYYLSLEIICSAIQADGVKTLDDGTTVKAVVDAWGVDPTTLAPSGN